MKKSGYLMQKKQEEAVMQYVQRRTMVRFMLDMITITLNDPQYMGNDAFGFDRIQRVLYGVQENCNTFFGALTTEPEADYYRAKMDGAIKRIVGNREGQFEPFEMRYPYVTEIQYTKEVRDAKPKKKRKTGGRK